MQACIYKLLMKTFKSTYTHAAHITSMKNKYRTFYYTQRTFLTIAHLNQKHFLLQKYLCLAYASVFRNKSVEAKKNTL